MTETPAASGSPRLDPDLGPDTGHEYDGIRELDNRLPNWWLATLLITIVFGYGYWLYYHVFTGPSLAENYKAEMAEAEARAAATPVTDDMILSLGNEGAEKGKAIFQQNCVACHGANGEGKIGPNLTDSYWLHGGRPSEIYTTISKGVVSRGMLSWEPVLGVERTRLVAAYVNSLKGKNLPGKAPEGAKLSN
jgi:cytochrome c oxidase cbb3-type subunit 3